MKVIHTWRLIVIMFNVERKSIIYFIYLFFWLANNKTLCCKLVTNTTTFRRNQTNRIFKIYHNLNCKNTYAVYLLECTKCKIQYVGNLNLSSILDSGTTGRMCGNQMLYLQAVIFQTKTVTSTHMQNSYQLNRYAISTLT